MNDEMNALVSRGTWELVSAPTDVVVGCRWVYTLKYRPDGLWIDIKSDLLLRAAHRHMVWIILRPLSLLV